MQNVVLCELCHPIVITKKSYKNLFNRKLLVIISFVRRYQTYDHVYCLIQDVCTFCQNNQSLHCLLGALGGVVVKALRHKPAGRGSIPDGVIGILQ